MAYNGWTNYETWNINLWLDNEEPLYRQKKDFIRRCVITADNIEQFCRDIFPDGTPDMDGGADDMNLVNWDEVEVSWRAEYEEG